MLLKSKRLFLGLRANLFIQEFPFAFLEAFDNKQTMLKKLKSGSHNQSDCSGVLQQNNIHLKVYTIGEVTIWTIPYLSRRSRKMTDP